jgi:hypothetical protein
LNESPKQGGVELFIHRAPHFFELARVVGLDGRQALVESGAQLLRVLLGARCHVAQLLGHGVLQGRKLVGQTVLDLLLKRHRTQRQRIARRHGLSGQLLDGSGHFSAKGSHGLHQLLPTPARLGNRFLHLFDQNQARTRQGVLGFLHVRQQTLLHAFHRQLRTGLCKRPVVDLLLKRCEAG